jgi:anti-sigma B factor antagonist
MSLEIEQRESEGIVILDLKGRLTSGASDLELRDRLRVLHEAGKVNIALNLKHVSHLDSTGLGTLVFALARIRKGGGRLALFNLNRAHLQLLSLTRLALAFDLFDNERDAIDSFFPDRAEKSFDILTFIQQAEGGELARKKGGLAPEPPAKDSARSGQDQEHDADSPRDLVE